MYTATEKKKIDRIFTEEGNRKQGWLIDIFYGEKNNKLLKKYKGRKPPREVLEREYKKYLKTIKKKRVRI